MHVRDAIGPSSKGRRELTAAPTPVPRHRLATSNASPQRSRNIVDANKHPLGGRRPSNLKIDKANTIRQPARRPPLLLSKQTSNVVEAAATDVIPRIPKQQPPATSRPPAVPISAGAVVTRPRPQSNFRPSFTPPAPAAAVVRKPLPPTPTTSKLPQSSPSSSAFPISVPARNFVSSRRSEAPDSSHHRPSAPSAAFGTSSVFGTSSARPAATRPPAPAHVSIQSLRSLIGKQLPQYNRPFTVNNQANSSNTSNDNSKHKEAAHPKSAAATRPGRKTSSDVSHLPKPRCVGGVPQPATRPSAGLIRPSLLSRGAAPVQGRPAAAFAAFAQSNRCFPVQRVNRRPNGYEFDPYGLDEHDDEDLDFIDDGPLEDDLSNSESSWKSELRGITGYNPAMFRDDGEATESSLTRQEQEEILSAQIAAAEDATELKKLQMEEERLKRLKAAKEKQKGY